MKFKNKVVFLRKRIDVFYEVQNANKQHDDRF